jgi:anti-sigma regulatory factor (Ser/Thr protein kinase)
MDTEAPRGVSTIYLSAEPNAVMLTRNFVRIVLTRYGLRDVSEDAELVASELATNAVQATNAAEPSYVVNSMKLPAIITVQVRLFSRFILVIVWDRSLGEPKLRPTYDTDETGRGLLIVENLSTRWGWETVHPYSGYMGKVVWAELEVPSYLIAAGLPLRRPTVDRYDPTVSLNPVTLRRVHRGLKRL